MSRLACCFASSRLRLNYPSHFPSVSMQEDAEPKVTAASKRQLAAGCSQAALRFLVKLGVECEAQVQGWHPSMARAFSVFCRFQCRR